MENDEDPDEMARRKTRKTLMGRVRGVNRFRNSREPFTNRQTTCTNLDRNQPQNLEIVRYVTEDPISRSYTAIDRADKAWQTCGTLYKCVVRLIIITAIVSITMAALNSNEQSSFLFQVLKPFVVGVKKEALKVLTNKYFIYTFVILVGIAATIFLLYVIYICNDCLKRKFTGWL